MSADNTETKKEGEVKTTTSEAREHLLPPSNIVSVFADKLTIAVNHTNDTVTMSVLTMHPIPTIAEKIDIDNYAYEISGEIKTSFAEMDSLAMYYLTTRTSNPNKLWNLMQEHFRQFPEDKDKTTGFMRFGPSGLEPVK